MIGDFILKAQPAEPVIRQVQMGLFTQAPLGANAVAIAHDQHADHQFRINRRTPNWAIEIGEIVAQVAEIETLINATQEMIFWDMVFKIERVKQPILPTR